MAWTIDTGHTSVGFVARHMGLSKVRGQFTSFRGDIEGDPSDITAAKARFEVDMASVDTGNADRDAHLKSADFFDVEKYPTITFRSRRVEPLGSDRFRVTGDLTIRGVTREVVLEATDEGRERDPWGGDRAGFTASGKIDRREFGLTWNQALETGGVLVSNDIRLSIEVQAVKVQQQA